MEAAEALVVLRHLALALQDVDLNGGLVVRGGGEHLALAGRDGGVAVDELGADAAERLDAERQRGHVEQQNAFDVAAEHAALNGSAHGHALIGVDALEGVFAGEALNGFLHGGDTGGAADEQHLAQIVHGEAGVAQRLTDRGHRALNEMMGQLVELRAGQRHVEMLRAVRVGGDIRQVDVGARHAGQIALRFFGGLAQTLHGDLIAGEVNALGLLELLNEVIGHALIKVVAAETGVARGGQNFDDAVADLEHGHIERAAAEVVDHDLLLGFLIETVGQSSRGRLVDYTFDLQAGDLAGVLGGLTLAVGEVRRDGDDRFGHGLAEIGFRVGLELLQHHGADLGGSVALAVDVDAVVGAHFTLDGGNGAVGVGDGLALCDLADHTLAGFGERYDGRRSARALGVGNDFRLAAFHNGDAAIGSAKIDTDDFRHNDCLLYRRNIFINYGMIYSNGRSVGDLHHTEADHPIAHFEALLELLHDLALALFGVFHVHDGVVLVGIEFLTDGLDRRDAERPERFEELGHRHFHALFISLVRGLLPERPFEIIKDRQQLFERVGLDVGVDVVALSGGALAEIVVFGAESEIFVLFRGEVVLRAFKLGAKRVRFGHLLDHRLRRFFDRRFFDGLLFLRSGFLILAAHRSMCLL